MPTTTDIVTEYDHKTGFVITRPMTADELAVAPVVKEMSPVSENGSPADFPDPPA